jgi:hypothetical protein
LKTLGRNPVSSFQLTRGIAAMSRRHILFTIITTISLLATCSSQNNGSRDIGLIDASKVTEIRVKVLDIKISGDKEFKTISTPTEISNIVSFANEQVLARSNLGSTIDKVLSVQDQSAQVNLAFYQSDNYLGTLGLGHYDNDKYFINYRQYSESQCCKSKAAVISSEQKKKLLDLIGYSEHEFEKY